MLDPLKYLLLDFSFSRKCKQRKSGGSRHAREDKEARYRASPARIVKLYPYLSAEQRKLIEDAGFGGLLKIRCSTLPSGLCNWLLQQFDTDSCELVIRGRGRIPVTSDSVHRILGIPNSGADVEYGLDTESIAFVFEKYGVANGCSPTITSIEKSLRQMKSADEHFLRTFMLLVVSTFLCPNSSLKISPRCFPSLVDTGSIRELNWCKFVVEQLKKCISAYCRKNTVGGCLFYLLILYLDSLDTRNTQIPDGAPRISAWNRKLIDTVIEMDMKNNGSFGKCFLKKKKRVAGNVNSRGASSASALFGRIPEIANFVSLNVPPGFSPQLKKGAADNTNSRGASSASGLFGGVSEIANFVSSNVLPGYNPKKKEVLCNAVGNLCSSITDALSKFMREVSGLEGCSGEASKDSGAALGEDNNVENNGDQTGEDLFPEDSSELATKDIEDTSVEEYENESSGEGEAGDWSSTDSEDDHDWEDDSNSITQNSDNNEPGDGTTKSGKGSSKSPGHDSDIPVGDQDRGNGCTEEHVNLAKRTPVIVDGDVVVPAPAAQHEIGEKRYIIVGKTTIQSASPLHGRPSSLRLYNNGSPSKGDWNMDKTPIIDLSTPTSSDSDCTVLRTLANPFSSVNGPKKSS